MKKQIVFDAFRLDQANQCVWKGSQEIRLRPKAFAVLTFLVGRRGHLVTKEELFTAVWPETFVGEAVLKVAIRQIREALGDDPKTPRFIETAHRRGYRFISPTVDGERRLTDDRETRSNDALPGLPELAADSSPKVVGRDDVLARMQGRLEKVLAGERQIVFVTGEAGIGKTAVVDTFIDNMAP